MRVGLVQSDPPWEARDANLEIAARDAAKAVDAGARLVLFPEMFAVGFTMAVDKVSEPPDGPTPSLLVELATRLDAYVGGSFPCRASAGERPTNRFVVAGPDAKLQHYDKIHPFSYGGEDRFYAPGTKMARFAIDELRATPFVCYDLRFADQFWQQASDTDVYLGVANWPAARQEHFDHLITARAIENQAYVVAVNRCGVGDGIAYRGGSAVIAPFGEAVARAGSGTEILLAEIDAAKVAEVRSRYRFLQDRVRVPACAREEE